MNGSRKAEPGVITKPEFQDYATRNALQMTDYGEDELRDMLHCNAEIARLNRQRYMHFFDEEPALQAVLAYTGIVFKHLNADDFTADDFRFAQQHLWITSFLYGLLRPLDGIKPYRLEGDVVLSENGVNMFDFWKPLLTDHLIRSIKEDGGVLIDLASKEMQRLFDWRKVKREVRVVRPEFFVRKGGKLKTIVIYAKMCRGEMAGFILRSRLSKADDILSFTYDGFALSEADTTSDRPVFVLEE